MSAQDARIVGRAGPHLPGRANSSAACEASPACPAGTGKDQLTADPRAAWWKSHPGYARAPAGLFLRVPAACWWARTVVESDCRWRWLGTAWPAMACETSTWPHTPRVRQRLKRPNTGPLPQVRGQVPPGQARAPGPQHGFHEAPVSLATIPRRPTRPGNKDAGNAQWVSVSNVRPVFTLKISPLRFYPL